MEVQYPFICYALAWVSIYIRYLAIAFETRLWHVHFQCHIVHTFHSWSHPRCVAVFRRRSIRHNDGPPSNVAAYLCAPERSGFILWFPKISHWTTCAHNQIPRQIPEQPFYLRSTPSIFMGGILPFGAIFIELYFIMNSIWFHRIYYGIGFLFLVFIVLILTASQVTILLCYFHLCAEDYRWAWRAFLTGAAAGFYVFLYSVLYYLTKLDINSFTSTILYFGYSGIISLLFGLLSGNLGI